MKPFNLEAAKAGAPVQTREGEKARIICFDRDHSVYPLVALIGDAEELHVFKDNGTFYGDGEESRRDLLMAPTKREGWINIYQQESENVDKSNVREWGAIYSTEENAKKQGHLAIATIKIEWEE